jgi:hypothetical protein
MSNPLKLLVILLCLPFLAHAEIYEWQDTEGHKHFSDRNHADAKKITVKPGYSYQTIKTVYDGDTVVLEDGRKIRVTVHLPLKFKAIFLGFHRNLTVFRNSKIEYQ